jgi:hypothetical protein
MKRAARLLLFAGLALGCHRVAAPPSRFPTAAAALDRIKAGFACQQGVKGEARIDQFSEHGRLRGKILLFASRPDRLRFDVMSPPPFNSIISTLTTESGRFALADLRERKFFEGAATACNVARLTEVPLEPHVLVTLLGGRAPMLVHQDAQLGMEWSMATTSFVFPVHAAPRRCSTWRSPPAISSVRGTRSACVFSTFAWPNRASSSTTPAWTRTKQP